MNPLFEKASHLLKPSEDRSRLVLSEDVLNALKQIKGPVLFVTVVGTQRGGKSTLLNLLHSRKTSGFGLGHFYDAQTTGLWVWAKKHPRNPDLTVVLMDTEGLDSPHIPQWYNWTLAALAVLISSFFIYQSKGSIDSSATDRLAVILKVAEQIGGRKEEGSDQPHFLWLIRDSQLNFKQSPKQEMLSMLDRNEKRHLENCFTEYDCFPLPRPVENESQLKEVEKLDWNDLRGEFREEYAILERQIYSQLSKPRKLSNKDLTGEMIGFLLEKYVGEIAKKGIMNDLSQLPTQQQMVAKMQGERAVKSAVDRYAQLSQEIEQKLPLPDLDIFKLHEENFKKARETFLSEVGADGNKIPKDLEDFYTEFCNHISTYLSTITFHKNECIESRKLISGKYFELLQKNVEISRKKCTEEIARLFQKLNEKLVDITGNFKSEKEFTDELETVRKLYNESPQAVGACKEHVATEFFREKFPLATQIKIVLLEKDIREKIEKQSAEFSRTSTEMKTAYTQQNADLLAKLEQLRTQFTSENKTLSDELQTKSKELQQKISEIERNLQSVTEEFRNKIAALNEDVSKKITTTNDDLRGKITQSVDEINSRITASAKKSDEGNDELQKKLKLETDTLNTKLNESIASSDKKLAINTESFDAKLSQVSKKFEGSVLESSQALIKKLEEEKERNSKQLADKSSDIDKKFTQNSEDLTKISGSIKSLDTRITELSQNSEKGIAAISSEFKTGIAAATATLEDKLEKLVLAAESKAEVSSNDKVGKLAQELRQNLSENVTAIQKNVAESNTAVKSQIQQLTTDLQQVNTDHSQLIKSLQDNLTKSSADINSQTDDLRKKMSQSSEESVQLKKSLSELDTKFTQYSGNSNTKVAQIQTEISENFGAIKKQAEELSGRTLQWNTTVNEKIEDLKKKTDESISNITTKTSQIQSDISTLSASVKQNWENSGEIDKQLTQKISEVEQKAAQSVVAVQRVTEENSQKFDGKFTEISALISANALTSQKLIEQQNAKFEEVKQSLATQENSAKSEQGKLRTEIAEISARIQENSKQQSTSIEELNKNITTTITATNADITELKKSVTELASKQSREIPQIFTEISNLSSKQQADNTSSQAKINEVSEQLADQIGKISEQLKKQSDEQLKQRLTPISERVDSLGDDIKNIKGNVEEQLSVVGKKSELLQNHVTKQSEDIVRLLQLESKHNTVSEKFEKLSDQVKKSDEKFTEMGQSSEKLSSQIISLTQSSTQQQESLNSLSKELSSVQSQVLAIPEKLSETQAKVSDLAKNSTHTDNITKITSKVDELSAIVSRVQLLSEKCTSLENSVNSTSTEISRVTKLLGERDSATTQIQEFQQQVQQQYQQHEQQLQSLTLTINSPPPSYQFTQLSEHVKQLSENVKQISESVSNLTENAKSTATTKSRDSEDLSERLVRLEQRSGNLDNELKKQQELITTSIKSTPVSPTATNTNTSTELLSTKTDEIQQKLAEISTHISKLESDNSVNETVLSEVKTTVIGLQTATKSTFTNVEKTLHALMNTVTQQGSDVKILSTEVQLIKQQQPSQTTQSQPQQQAGERPPPPYPNASPTATTLPAGSTPSAETQEIMRAIAGVKSTAMRYTDNAIEGVAATMADLIQRVQNVEALVKNHVTNVASSGAAGIPAGSTATGNSAGNSSSSSSTVTGDSDTDKKFVDVYAKLGNLMSTYNQLSSTVQKMSGTKPPAGSDQKSSSSSSSNPNINAYIDEQLIEQRKQLVSAMKAHVANVEDSLKVEIRKITEGSRGLERRLENIATFTTPSTSSSSNTNTTISSDSNVGGALVILDNKFAKLGVQFDHLKTSVDALWGSLGQISSKLVDLESELDKR